MAEMSGATYRRRRRLQKKITASRVKDESHPENRNQWVKLQEGGDMNSDQWKRGEYQPTKTSKVVSRHWTPRKISTQGICLSTSKTDVTQRLEEKESSPTELSAAHLLCEAHLLGRSRTY
jgi:hypothetical protein